MTMLPWAGSWEVLVYLGQVDDNVTLGKTIYYLGQVVGRY